MRDRDSISENKDYNTPPNYLRAVREYLGSRIALDPCSNAYSMVAAETEWRLPDTDGLQQDWSPFPSIFVNPPYGTDAVRGTSIRDWCVKCVRTHAKNPNAQIFLLIPVATNTRHWKDSVFPFASHICFLYDTRVRFWEHGRENAKGSPMPCCIVHYGGDCEGRSFMEHFKTLGVCLRIAGNVSMRNNPAEQAEKQGEFDF